MQVRIDYRGRRLQIGHIISGVDMENIRPRYAPPTPYDLEWGRNEERRRRYIELISNTVALSLTQALLEETHAASK